MNEKYKPINIEKDIEQLVKQYFKHSKSPNSAGYLYSELIARVERELIKQVLHQTEQNQSKTAKILGVSRTTLRKKMSELNLMNTDKSS
ncbi:MAG: helix-turn-helix domain-containing protein [Gammaproteobacteria bacterium]|nr:helix-turn-helix domain-containing protein [Gammaproteobacteria bacterium]